MGDFSRPEMMAWQQTVANHGAWLRGQIAARLDPGEPVDDILQETLESAIAGGKPTEPLRDIRSWLAGIARNKVRQHIDRNCRARRFRGRLEIHQEEVEETTPDEFLLDRERVDLVRCALATIAPETAALLRSKYFHGWSYARIGQHLGLNENAVTNRLREARRALREALQHHYDTPDSK